MRYEFLVESVTFRPTLLVVLTQAVHSLYHTRHYPEEITYYTPKAICAHLLTSSSFYIS